MSQGHPLYATIFLIVISSCCFLAMGEKKKAGANFPIPPISQAFRMSSVEIDDTDNGTIIAKQSFVWDPPHKRTKMMGAFKYIFLEQIIRCDGPISPLGYFLNMHGASSKSLTCTNQTIDEEFTNFWNFPANASYEGRLIPPKYQRAFNAWEYWVNSEKWMFYADVKTKSSSPSSTSVIEKITPIWVGKIFTTVPGYHLFHVQYADFIPGSPPLADFEPTPRDISCKNTTENDIFSKKEQFVKEEFGMKKFGFQKW